MHEDETYTATTLSINREILVQNTTPRNMFHTVDKKMKYMNEWKTNLNNFEGMENGSSFKISQKRKMEKADVSVVGKCDK
jgi:hypothetical protein